MSPAHAGLTKPKALHEPSFVQLGVFHAIMITGSVSRAARLMGVTQSAASKLLGQLEKDIGLRLFERTGQRLVPTSQAQQLQESVEQLYGSYGVVQRQIGSLSDQDRGHVSVAAIPTQATTFLPQAIKQLRMRYPGITVTVEILANQPIVDRVQHGQADFGLVHDVTPTPATLNEDLGLQHVVCVAPAGHRYSGLPHVTIQDLKDETFLSYGPQTNFGAMLANAFEGAAIRMPVSVETTSSSALLALIRSGVGVGLVEPAAIVPFGPEGLVIKAFRPTLPVYSRIVRSRMRPLTRHAELLLDAYREAVLGRQPSYFTA